MYLIAEIRTSACAEDGEAFSQLFMKSLGLTSGPSPQALRQEYEDCLADCTAKLRSKSFTLYDFAKAIELKTIFQSEVANEKLRTLNLLLLEIRFYFSLVRGRLVSEAEVLELKHGKRKFALKRIQKLGLSSFFGPLRELSFQQCFDLCLGFIEQNSTVLKDLKESSLISREAINRLLTFALLLEVSGEAARPEALGGTNTGRIFANAIGRQPQFLAPFITVVAFFESRNGQFFDHKAFEAVRTFWEAEIRPFRHKATKEKRLLALLEFLERLREKANPPKSVKPTARSPEIEHLEYQRFLDAHLPNEVA